MIGPILRAEGAMRTTFRWGRIDSNADWILPVLATIAAIVFVRAMYRRDAREVGRGLGWFLTALRSVAFFGVLLLYLDPQWRTEREVALNSRVLVLVDTSSSMGLIDADSSPAPGAANRAEQVATGLTESDFLPALRKAHDVVVLKFDSEISRIATLAKTIPSAIADPTEAPQSDAAGRSEVEDWRQALVPRGLETRLGQALRQLAYDERGAPVSGLIVFTDGGQNAGIGVEPAIEVAREAKIPVFTVGVGSSSVPTNIRVYRLEALPRAYPGDPYTVSGLIQAQGPAGEVAGRSVTVQLLQRKGDTPGEAGSGRLLESQEVILGADGEPVPVKFELTPRETGRHTLCLRVVWRRPDQNPADDYRETDVDVVDRKDRVLIVAGGPSRDYQFLRTQLYRDPAMTVDILLQSAPPGISQEADKILDEFPGTREAMFEYDCVVAFDPDWKALDTPQVDLLESWVAEQGGGLIVVAGPVYTGEAITGWTADPAMSKIRALYPVEFEQRPSVLESGSYASEDPWPLEFTREGLEAEYLWLGDTVQDNQRTWAELPGVYSHFPVRGPKSAATVLARFADPRARRGGDQPVYFAEHFYGSGRVFYMGSAELWRLRAIDPGWFERISTRLIRHVSQGRLLRESSRGLLLVGQDRQVLGGTVPIRAQLTNAQLGPLEAASVALEVFEPDGSVNTLSLRADPTRAGTFAGQLTVLEEGLYRLELPVPNSDERIIRRVQVTLPDLERQSPQRNDKLLERIADASGGKYYPDLAQALNTRAPDSLVSRLKDRTKTMILTAGPDPKWEEAWMRWWMVAVAGVLCVEWLVRRLAKLA